MTTPIIDHTYSGSALYRVSLTVTDDDGATSTVTRWVPVMRNRLPLALFEGIVTGTQAALDGSESYDPNGTLVGYSWDFGDGSPVDTTGPVPPPHDYALPGPYIARLTVTDDDGLTGTIGHEVSLGGNDWDDTGVLGPVKWNTIGATPTWLTVTPTDLKSGGFVSTVPARAAR